jgi:hypothetical protein
VTHYSEPSAEERLAGQQVGPSDEAPGEPVAPQAAAEEGSQDATPPGGTAETPEQMAVRLQELTADLQRLQAEYVNYKRRVDRDRELVLQNAKFSILSALLPVLDDVDRAREHEELSGGFKAVADSLERIVAGEGTWRDMDTLLELSEQMTGKTICVLSDSCATPIVSGIQRFRGEFEAHIKRNPHNGAVTPVGVVGGDPRPVAA